MSTVALSHDERLARSRHPTARRRLTGGRPPARFYALTIITVALTLTGVLMVLSASSVDALHQQGSPWLYFVRQALYAAVGFVAMFAMVRIDYRRWRALVPVALLVTLGLLVAVLVAGREVNGARAWLEVWGPFRLQPSEFAKLTLLVYTSSLLARRRDQLHRLRRTLVPVLVVFAVFGGLVMAQRDLGTVAVMAGIVLAVLWIAGTPMLPLTAVAASMAAVGTAFVFSTAYRRDRWLSFLDPWADPLNDGHQAIQSFVGIASGGLTGVGLGAGRAKWGFLPEAHTDFIFAVIAEELGLVGVLAVVGLFVAFAVLGVRAALTAPDRFGQLLAGGITAWIIIQAMVNLGAVVGLMPITGLTLPFVSFGGSSLVVLLAATGILLNVARQGRNELPVTAPATTARVR